MDCTDTFSPPKEDDPLFWLVLNAIPDDMTAAEFIGKTYDVKLLVNGVELDPKQAAKCMTDQFEEVVKKSAAEQYREKLDEISSVVEEFTGYLGDKHGFHGRYGDEYLEPPVDVQVAELRKQMDNLRRIIREQNVEIKQLKEKS